MVGMEPSLSLTLFMSYLIDGAKDGEITNIRPSVFLAELVLGKLASTALCSCFAANHAPESRFGETNAYSIHWLIHLHNYMWHNILFYTFNKDNIEHVAQVKQGHVEYLRLVWQR